MKRPLTPAEQSGTTLTHHEEGLFYSPECNTDHEALLAQAPAHHAADPLGDGSADADVEPEADEGQLRRWKAEQANKALWDFGGKIKRVQQDWRRLQEQLRVAAAAAPAKRARPDPAPNTYSGPLLALNQLYWEQNMGASISGITEPNMFGINMHGSYSSICAQMLRGSSPATAAAAGAAHSRAAPSNSSSNGQQHQQQQQEEEEEDDSTTSGPVGEQQCLDSPVTQTRDPHQQQSSHQQQQQWEEAVGESDHAFPHTPSNGPQLPTPPDAAPTTAAVQQPQQQQQPFDLDEIEAVCRAQGLSHLPASRRFVRALRIIKAAKQQQQQQQQQQSVALEQQPALPLVAVV